MKTDEATGLYLSYVEHTRNLSHQTIKAYKQDIALFLSIVGHHSSLTSVSRLEIRQVINTLFAQGQSKSTVKRRVACYKSMFSWFENEELIQQTPFHKLDIKIKLPLRLPRNLSNEELKKLRRASIANLEMANTRNANFKRLPRKLINHLTTFMGIELLLTTGLRISELTNITLSDVYLDERYINISGKGQRERRVFITTEDIAHALKQYLSLRQTTAVNHNLLLINKQGKPATSQTFRLWLKALSKQAKVKRNVTPHMYRHSAATKLLEAGVDIRYVQRLLGHQSITTTEIYTHVNNISLYEAVIEADVRKELL